MIFQSIRKADLDAEPTWKLRKIAMQSAESFAPSGWSTDDELKRIKTFSTSTSASTVARRACFWAATVGTFADATCCSRFAVFRGSKRDEMFSFAAATPMNGRPRSMRIRNFTAPENEALHLNAYIVKYVFVFEHVPGKVLWPRTAISGLHRVRYPGAQP
jgi:hypothetical protein